MQSIQYVMKVLVKCHVRCRCTSTIQKIILVVQLDGIASNTVLFERFSTARWPREYAPGLYGAPETRRWDFDHSRDFPTLGTNIFTTYKNNDNQWNEKIITLQTSVVWKCYAVDSRTGIPSYEINLEIFSLWSTRCYFRCFCNVMNSCIDAKGWQTSTIHPPHATPRYIPGIFPARDPGSHFLYAAQTTHTHTTRYFHIYLYHCSWVIA